MARTKQTAKNSTAGNAQKKRMKIIENVTKQILLEKNMRKEEENDKDQEIISKSTSTSTGSNSQKKKLISK